MTRKLPGRELPSTGHPLGRTRATRFVRPAALPSLLNECSFSLKTGVQYQVLCFEMACASRFNFSISEKKYYQNRRKGNERS
jgi:hypothetical protein